MLPKLNLEKIILLVVTIIVCVMVIYPISVLVYNSFIIAEWGRPVIYTLNNYAKIFKTTRYLLSLKNSLIISFGTTVLAGVP